MRSFLFLTTLSLLIGCSSPAETQGPTADTTATPAPEGVAANASAFAAESLAGMFYCLEGPAPFSALDVEFHGNGGEFRTLEQLGMEGAWTMTGSGTWSLNGNTLTLEGDAFTVEDISDAGIRLSGPTGSFACERELLSP